MAEELIISVSGVRGIVGENLTPSIAADYGSAFGTFIADSCTGEAGGLSVCIGMDSRASGPMLSAAAAAGLMSVGIDVIQLGVVTTPGVSVMVTHRKCAGGVIITASHNPIRYNGIKLLLGNGMAPPGEVAEQIKQRFLDKKFTFADSVGCGKVTSQADTDDVHVDKVLRIVDRERIAEKRISVVLDSVNGAGGAVTRKLLARLGCEVYAVNQEPNGLFAHGPEPVAENLGGLCELVKEKNAAVGFAQDPDADRLAVVDENGTYIGEEYTLALAAKYIFSKRTGRGATNLSTSRMIDDIAQKTGNDVIRTAVGEANVAAAMLKNGCIIGGEGNGGVIDLRVSGVRDSLVAIALVLQLTAETGKSISQLAGDIGSYYMKKDKFPADKAQADSILAGAKQLFAEGRLDTSDGCRFDFDRGWLALRASNTEPVVRVIAEANDRQTAEKYIDAVMKLREKAAG